MSDEELIALAQPFLAYMDARNPEIRGHEDIVSYARTVMAAQRVELRKTFLDRVREALSA